MLVRRALPGVAGSTLAVILAFSVVSVLNAQINRGVIEGIVSDAQGAIVAGAQVEITSIDTNITARTTTNDSGYYRVGDLHTDNEGIGPLLAKLKITADLSKAQGKYRSAEIDRKPNRPHVTVQRPYFDLTKSQVVDRTIILMAR